MNILSGLTVILIVLKVFKVIDWNWLLVLSPAIVEVTIFGILIYIAKQIINRILDEE